MRRPPDKDRSQLQSERDIDSSNATLNTVFGGSKLKIWQTGQTSVRPTPRSSISKASGNFAQLPQRNITAVLPSPTPSDEASPILSHSTITSGSPNQNQRRTFIQENPRPGASGARRPSVTISHSSEAIPQVLSTTQTQTQVRVPSSTFRSGRADLPSPVITNTEPLRSDLSISPLAEASTPQSITEPLDTSRLIRELRSPSLPPLFPNQQHSRSSSERLQSRISAPQTTITQEEPPQARQKSRGQLSSPSPLAQSSSPGMALEQTPLPSSVLLAAQNPPVSIPSYHPKRQRIHAPMQSLKSRVSLINSHVESVGGIHFLNNNLERPRFQLLCEACNNEDLFYVALHQLFCVWDSSGRTIIASFGGILQGIPDSKTLSVAFKTLGQLIRHNEGLAPNHLKWLIDFPSPFSDLVKASEPYRNVLSDVGSFLVKLSSDWGTFSRQCSQRGYPPLVDELVNRMGLPSKILQQIMFTATRRNLGIIDDRHGEKMEKIFVDEDLRGHQQLAMRYNTGRPPTALEIETRNQALIEKYLTINNQRLHARRTSNPAMMSPLAGSPVMPGSGSVHLQMVNNDAAYQLHRQNSNAAFNLHVSHSNAWQQAQQARHGRVVSVSSPSPIVHAVAGRPLSGMGQRSYQSPTTVQGFSMHSPIVQSPIQQQQGFQWPDQNTVLRSNSVQKSSQNMEFPHGNVSVPTSRPHSASQPQPHAQQQLPQNMQPQILLQQQQEVLTQRQQRRAMDAQQWQSQAHSQAHHQAQQAQQAQQALQIQQQIESQRRQIAAQSVLAMNRAAQLRSNSESIDVLQYNHSRNNSISSAGGQSVPTPAGNSPNVHLPRSLPSSNALQNFNSTHPLQRPLVPPLGYVQPSQPTNPDMTALHQAHIRSPRLVLEDTAPKLPEDDPSRRFYQSVKDFVLSPTKISIASALSTFEFSISDAAYGLITKYKTMGPGSLPVRCFKRGSLQYRLRCITSKRNTIHCSVSDFAVSDTVWPETIFVEINSQQLEIRRKNHHGKDLPIDITSFVIPKSSQGSTNRIKVSTPRLRKVTADVSYFIAVEVVEVLQHPQVMEMCTQYQRIPLSKTLDAIKRSLAPPPADDDDDFAMVIGDLSIDLADPFTSRIFEIPVRGNSCMHRECFDLETFLLTRNSKPKRPGQPSMIDVWKCPLCGKDARPYCLEIDDFLVNVRAELAEQDKLDIKSILVSPDGSWRAKVELRTMKRKATGFLDEYDDTDSSDGEGTARRQQAIARTKNPHLNGGGGRASKDVEIIELD